MPTMRCPGCGWQAEVECSRPGGYSSIRLDFEGVLTCKRAECGTSWPVKIVDNVIEYVAPEMPTHGSRDLGAGALEGLRQDLQEADRAHFAQCYKAAVVVCRRAIQLALEDKGAEGRTLGPVLVDAREKDLLTDRTDALVEGIKDFGDGGAHRAEDIHVDDAAMVIRVTTVVLNELFPEPDTPTAEVSDVEELPW